jgi:hypothetical protein
VTSSRTAAPLALPTNMLPLRFGLALERMNVSSPSVPLLRIARLPAPVMPPPETVPLPAYVKLRPTVPLSLKLTVRFPLSAIGLAKPLLVEVAVNWSVPPAELTVSGPLPRLPVALLLPAMRVPPFRVTPELPRREPEAATFNVLAALTVTEPAVLPEPVTVSAVAVLPSPTMRFPVPAVAPMESVLAPAISNAPPLMVLRPE